MAQTVYIVTWESDGAPQADVYSSEAAALAAHPELADLETDRYGDRIGESSLDRSLLAREVIEN